MITSEQKTFNELIGRLYDIIHGENYTTVVLHVGKSNPRIVALAAKNEAFEQMCKQNPININQVVKVKFYISSREANNRYYTNAHILEICELPSLQV